MLRIGRDPKQAQRSFSDPGKDRCGDSATADLGTAGLVDHHHHDDLRIRQRRHPGEQRHVALIGVAPLPTTRAVPVLPATR